MKAVVWLLLLLMLFMVLSASARGAEIPSVVDHLESLTREEAIRHALDHHPKLAQAGAHLRQAEARLAEVRRWFRPNISVYAGRRFDQDSQRFGVQVSQDVDALWDRSRQRQAEAAVAALEQEQRLTRQAVVEEAAGAYDGWILARMDLRRRRAERSRAALALQRAREQYDEGLISASRLAELEKSLEESERSAAEAFAHLSRAALRLRHAMGEVEP